MNGIILVTGGCGYIGSHVVVQLIENGYEVILFDNLSNSSISVITKIEEITQKKPYFVKGDVRDAASLQHTFSQYPIDAVIHLAGLKAVGEAEKKPLEYYDNNVQGSMPWHTCIKPDDSPLCTCSAEATAIQFCIMMHQVRLHVIYCHRDQVLQRYNHKARWLEEELSSCLFLAILQTTHLLYAYYRV